MPFDAGQTPTIAVQNKSTLPLGYDLDKMIAASQKFVETCFAPVWGVSCNLQIVDPAGAVPDGCWSMLIVDDADEPGAEGYHDVQPTDLPQIIVGVRSTQQAGDDVAVTVIHEICEGLVDPDINLVAEAPDGTEYGYEVCDAVEAEEFEIDGVKMSNFQYPAWFEGTHAAGSRKFDYLGTCQRPFQINKGGYMPVKRRGRWTQVFGSKESQAQHSKRKRRRHQLRVAGGRLLGTARDVIALIREHRRNFEQYVLGELL